MRGAKSTTFSQPHIDWLRELPQLVLKSMLAHVSIEYKIIQIVLC